MIYKIKHIFSFFSNAVAEIVVKDCSRVLVLLTTGKSDTGSCVTNYNGNCPLNFNKISK